MSTATHEIDVELSSDEQALLARYGFSAQTFVRLRDQLAAGEFPPERNRVSGPVVPPNQEDLTAWPAPGSVQSDEWTRAGAEAMQEGRVAAAILNGGMATRFGGVVKGIVEVLDDQSFLGLKLRDIARSPGRTPVFVMNSFATEQDTRQHLERNRYFGLAPEDVHLVSQRISMRLTHRGEVARSADGRASFYAPGHGDIFEVLAESDAFSRFVDSGGRAVMVSNVDNLAASFSAKVIGAHLTTGQQATVEVAPRYAADKGGAPVRLEDRVAILEGFRFPADFDVTSVPVFNTNTLILDAAAVKPDWDLTWFRVDKTVEGRGVVQFERLMGEVTSFVDSTFLEVPRVGSEGRFMPVKTPDDLIGIRPALRERFGSL
jgi:UTP--glucose-1-phosphate uridylyltransferase